MNCRKLVIIFFGLFVVFICPHPVRADLNISPHSRAELIEILKGLADDHAYKNWCEKNCGQIHRFRLSGTIASGELNLDIWGHIVGKDNGVLPLFGSAPAVEVKSLSSDAQEVPLAFYDKAYYTFLPPGPFHLTGQLRIDRTSSTNFTLPGAVGRVILDIADQEPLLQLERLGQVGGSFQIVSSANRAERHVIQTQALRLDITREFLVARDKTFAYTVHVVGAKTGEVISFPLLNGEKVLKTVPDNVKISADKVEFTATARENRFVIEGEWTKNDIRLTAAAGAVKETWIVECQGAYDCAFGGDVEKAVGAAVHQWDPLAGQTLHVTWKELGMLKGQSLVVQQALLDSRYTGKGLKQKLVLDLSSSAASQVFVDLPEGAIPVSLQYGHAPSPILKNDKGQVHLSVPQGTGAVDLEWELGKRESSAIPLPALNLPVGKWTYWVKKNENESAAFVSGPAGSPVVLFWPRMMFCVFVGLLFLLTEKRLLKKQITKPALFLILCAGYALVEPFVILLVIGFLAAIRLLEGVKEPRTVFGWFFEGGVLLFLLFAAFASFFEILDNAFFTNLPFAYRDFCSSTSVLGQFLPQEALCWETTLLYDSQEVTAPFVLVVSTLAVRVVYFAWALAVGVFFFLELKNLWNGIKHYMSLGLRPAIKKPVKN